MNEFELVYKGEKEERETITVPSTWNELTLPQLLYIAEYWEAWTKLQQINESLIKAKALLVIELMSDNTPANKARRVEYFKMASNEDLYELCQLVNFVFEKNTLTTNHIKHISCKGVKYFGPPDKLNGLKAEEFSFSDGLYMQYHKTKEIRFLEAMIAVLYRPGNEKKGDDPRMKFDKNLHTANLMAARKLSYAEKQAILLFYIGSRTAIAERNPHIFTKGGAETQASNSTWIDVILAMSGTKFGNFRETCDTEIYLIFKELENLKEKK